MHTHSRMHIEASRGRAEATEQSQNQKPEAEATLLLRPRLRQTHGTLYYYIILWHMLKLSQACSSTQGLTSSTTVSPASRNRYKDINNDQRE